MNRLRIEPVIRSRSFLPHFPDCVSQHLTTNKKFIPRCTDVASKFAAVAGAKYHSKKEKE